MKLGSKILRRLAGIASLSIPSPAGDYAPAADRTGYVPQPHVADTSIDDQTGLRMTGVTLGAPYAEHQAPAGLPYA